MPSRRKKVLNNSKLTHAFFNQVGSSVCSCCGDESHHYAYKAVNPGDSDNGEFIDIGPGENPFIQSLGKTNHGIDDATSSSVPAIIGKEQYKKPTHPQKQELQAAIDRQPAISKPQAIKRALQLAHKQVTDVPAIDDHLQPTTTFNLDDLDEVAEAYDRVCSGFKAEEERITAGLTGIVGDLAVTASDPDRSCTDRLAAKLDINVWNIHGKLNVPLSSMIYQTQLFNIEKRFGCVEEDYQALVNGDKKCSGEDVPAKLPLSFRQKWNNPSKLVESASKPRKKKTKKRLAGIEAVDQIQRNIKLAIEEFQELKETIRNAEKPIKLPDLPASFTFAGIPVPRDIPDDIRQLYFDVEFVYDVVMGFEEAMGLQNEASEQLSKVREMLKTWFNAGHEVWYVHYGAILTCLVPRFAANEAFLEVAVLSLSDTISIQYPDVKSMC